MRITNRSKKSGPKLRILLVDDDPIFGHVMKTLASTYNIDLVFLSSLNKVTLSSNWNFDLMIVDYELENINGLQFVEHVNRYLPNMNIVIASAYTRLAQTLKAPSIKAVIPKSVGPLAVLSAALSSCNLTSGE